MYLKFIQSFSQRKDELNVWNRIKEDKARFYHNKGDVYEKSRVYIDSLVTKKITANVDIYWKLLVENILFSL